ncbi:MAG TPA: CBS domain-containing protein [Thermoanaerobaculia bacterium]|nr:CBS domain-containing protein [Thermoanaerobaculia bacterium]
MRVQDVMTSPAHSCTPDASLAAAALAMQEYGCGALPVLDNAGRPVGILTDRDVCMAVARKNRFPAAIPVREVMTLNPFTCGPRTDLGYALSVMADGHIRRLPVVDSDGRLVGILSFTDVLTSAQETRTVDTPLLRKLVAASRPLSRPLSSRQGYTAPPN